MRHPTPRFPHLNRLAAGRRSREKRGQNPGPLGLVMRRTAMAREMFSREAIMFTRSMLQGSVPASSSEIIR